MKRAVGMFKVIVSGIIFYFVNLSSGIPIVWAAEGGETLYVRMIREFRNLPPAVFWVSAAGAVLILVLAVAVLRYRKRIAKMSEESSLYKKQVEKFKTMVEHLDDGVLVVKKLEFLYANKTVFDMMEIPSQEYVSTSLVDYVHPEDLDIVLENYEKSIFNSGEEINFEVRLLRKDQSVLWVHSRFIPARWNGEPVNLAIVKDVTSRKMMEKDLIQAQRLEAIGALSGGIAHEFNNILTTIIGSSEVALMDLKEKESGRKEFLRIRESGHRASDLVRQILTISREHGQEVHPVYLTPIIKEGLKLLRSTLARNIRIVEKIDRELHLVRADSIQIYQIFMNLCTNAKHAMEKEVSPLLEVELKNQAFYTQGDNIPDGVTPGNYVSLSVKDNGPGISSDAAGRLFDPYFTTKNRKTATGLGLTTTLGIVKQLDGYIVFESEKGKGSCFTVYFPVHETAKKSVKRISGGETPETSEGNILFVDDEEEITLIAKKMFEHLGYSVMTASSGREALEHFSRKPEFFDILITDLAMPEMAGDALVREIKKIRPEFPVVMCTGHSDIFDESTAKNFGVIEYITKPYNLKELSMIASRHIQREIAA